MNAEEKPDFVIVIGTGSSIQALHKKRQTWTQDPGQARVYKDLDDTRQLIDQRAEFSNLNAGVIRFSEFVQVLEEHGVLGHTD